MIARSVPPSAKRPLPGSVVRATGRLTAPGTWPRCRAFPWNPRYSAGGRASRISAPGDPTSARGERGRTRLMHGVTDRTPGGEPGAVAAVEDADRLQAVRAQAPPGPGRVEAGRVVVDDDRAAVADPGPGDGGGHLVGWGEQQQRVRILGIDEGFTPVEVCGVRGVARGEGKPGRPVR